MNNTKFHINILVPLAGKGQRFKDAGYIDPKPLININGRAMLEWAMESFDFLSYVDSYSFIFVVSKPDVRNFKIDKKILELYPNNSTIIILDNQTNGQAETCLRARDLINNNDKLIIYNCDTFSLSEIWTEIKTKDPDGIITYFTSMDSRYSYIRVNKSGLVVEVAEKNTISNMASTGMYYFKHGSLFVKAAEKMLKNKQLIRNEYYVMPCYADLISQDKRIIAVKVKTQVVFGTPEELIASKTKLKQ